MALKWYAGNGTPGCMFDNIEGPFDSSADARISLSELLELNEEEEADLLQRHILYFKGDRVHEVGAQYCEIWEGEDEGEGR